MNCDQVFDVLTRGPFPTGTSCDGPVEAHLEACAECRQLAEALRPALELFQEAVDPEESRDLPGYWCSLAADHSPPLVSYATPLEARLAPAPRRSESLTHEKHWSALTGWRMAAMLVLGAMLGSLLSSRTPFEQGGPGPVFGSGAAVSSPGAESNAIESGRHESGKNGSGVINIVGTDTVAGDSDKQHASGIWPVSIGSPDSPETITTCFRDRADSLRGERLLAAADLGHLICCSECHNASLPSVSSETTIRVAQSCQVCHKETRPGGTATP